MRVVVVTAVEAERDAVRAAAPAAEVVVAGIGPAAAAAATAVALGQHRADLVLSAGIGGGFAPLGPGELAVAATIAHADLRAETPDGHVDIPGAPVGYPVEPRLALELADRTGGLLGTIVTVSTVTGSAASAAELTRRYPDVVAEGMEGAGVAAAAALHRVPFAELRAISNLVGPRDREAWRIPEALAALGRAVAAIIE